MSDTPKFEIVDRRRMKAEEEQESHSETTPQPSEPPAAKPAEPAAGPRLVVNEGRRDAAPVEEADDVPELEQELPPAPTAEESREQKAAYEVAAQRLEDLIRAQNPGAGPQPAVGFEHLVQQFYVSAMIQMGAGTQEGQRPRVDILGARNTIDMLAVLVEKTHGNLSAAEERTLQTVLFELRMAFLDLTSMISMQGVQAPPPPPPAKR